MLTAGRTEGQTAGQTT